jgi:hypothetical protein
MDTNTDYKKILIDSILSRQEADGCWNALPQDHPHYSDWNYYIPNYSSTLWTLILSADIATDYRKKDFLKPLQTIAAYFFDSNSGIYTIKKSHFPIPCLNGNMLYLHHYFDSKEVSQVESVIEFFDTHQRFDDGDYKTPSAYPYCANKSCYGKHSCYWGVVKLLKGLSFIPKSRRSARAKRLLQSCIDFILLHRVCYASRSPDRLLHKSIQTLSFPNMYKADFLEIVWLLKREGVRSEHMDAALDLLKSKRGSDGNWNQERSVGSMVIPLGKRNYGNSLVNERAQAVLAYYRP